MAEFGRVLLGLGLALVAIGGGMMVLARLGVPFPLGRLPGDIVVQREGFTVYLPLATSIVVSLVLSLLFYLLRR